MRVTPMITYFSSRRVFKLIIIILYKIILLYLYIPIEIVLQLIQVWDASTHWWEMLFQVRLFSFEIRIEKLFMKKKYIIKLWLIFLILYLVYYMTILHPFPVYIYICVCISQNFMPSLPTNRWFSGRLFRSILHCFLFGWNHLFFWKICRSRSKVPQPWK